LVNGCQSASASHSSLKFGRTQRTTSPPKRPRVRQPMVIRSFLSMLRMQLARITYAKANPGKINMASAGIGDGTHVSGELFKMMAGVGMVHVPYRGAAPALTDLLGGQVQVMFSSMPAFPCSEPKSSSR